MASLPPESSDPARAEADALDLAAAEWIVRHDRGLDTAGRREFERWCRADPRHELAFRQLQETWALLERVPAERLPVPPRRGRRWHWVATGLAAAAAVTIALLAPGLLPQGGSAARRVATPIGGFERLELPDGSVIQLNTASAVTVAFSAGERRVTLVRGEASFAVARDTSRPFVVRVGAVDVRALGTAFNVRHRGGAVDVLVTEGRVSVDDAVSGRSLLPIAAPSARPALERASESSGTPAAALPILAAGQRATIALPERGAPQPAQVVEIPAAEAARVLAWHGRHLEFSDELLVNIAAEFNRYNPHRLVIADAELGAQRFGGKFPANDFATFVRLLETNFGVMVERRENETVLRRPSQAR